MSEHDEYRAFTVPLGVPREGPQAVWNPSKDPHLAIVGATGSGKTVVAHGVIQQMAQAGWRVWLIDGKRVEFTGYDNWPNVELLAHSVDHQVRVLKSAYDTLNARYDLINKNAGNVEELTPIFLVIDELSALVEFVSERYSGVRDTTMPIVPQTLKWIADIARFGRAVKVHLVATLQRPDPSIFGGEMWGNFARVSMGNLPRDGSMSVWGDPEIGTSAPVFPGGKRGGVALIDGKPELIQAYYTPNPADANHSDHDQRVIEAARPGAVKHPRRFIADQPEQGQVTWQRILDASVLDSWGEPVTLEVI